MLTRVIATCAVLCAPLNVLAACPDLEGNLIQGGLVYGEVAPGSQVTLDGDALTVLEDGTFFAGFGRDNAATAELVITGDSPCTQTLNIASREYRISRVEGVPQKTVTPSEEHLARIRRERALVSAAKRQRLDREDLLLGALAGFEWPATGRISGVYGSQRFYNGKPGNPHYGVDVAVPTGTPVYAPTAGVVTLAEDDLFYSGGTVILDHGFGLSSSFLHMSKIHVEVGQELKTGDLLGEVGATGRATGPHLDWRMSWRNQRVDPQLLVPPMPEQ
ncbi:M23 family metallopeptidase [Halioglobus japonicus]|uniref:M23 family metallopeptidase n=1 Tax=Halioglobus japonicus TaxID=930805 RepID=UPI001E53C9BB|nr:M23 family metallopeptidase [Halioglobus japonicus]